VIARTRKMDPPPDTRPAAQHLPIITGLSSTYLYRAALEYGPPNNSGSIG
jgi:hypothetical protein